MYYLLTAGQKFQEVCGGSYGNLGRCIHGLRCTASEERFLAGEVIHGVCLSKYNAWICWLQ